MRVIHLARKPLIGTVAANVLEHGTGALHIDACRAGYTSEADLALTKMKNPGKGDEKVTSQVYGAGRPQQSVNTKGRWPANVILQHLEGCFRKGTVTIKADRHYPGTELTSPGGGGVTMGKGWSGRDGIDRRTREEIPAWDCKPGCPVADLDSQVPNAGAAAPVRGTEPSAAVTEGGVYNIRDRVGGVFHGDKGGASRFFKQVGGEPCE